MPRFPDQRCVSSTTTRRAERRLLQSNPESDHTHTPHQTRRRRETRVPRPGPREPENSQPHLPGSPSRSHLGAHQSPINTVGQPGGNTLPVGLGMGATHDVCTVISPTRAAGIFSMSTVEEPSPITPGPAGIQPGNVHGVVVSRERAAGWLPISTVVAPLRMATGTAGCGTGVGTGAGGWMGAWQWGVCWMAESPRRAAGLDMSGREYRHRVDKRTSTSTMRA